MLGGGSHRIGCREGTGRAREWVGVRMNTAKCLVWDLGTLRGETPRKMSSGQLRKESWLQTEMWASAAHGQGV